MKNIQIYHNPRCSKSRAGLTLLEELTTLLQKLDMKPGECDGFIAFVATECIQQGTLHF